MHYEQHIQYLNVRSRMPSEDFHGYKSPQLEESCKKTDDILQNINKRKGKIVSVTPITKGSYDYKHDYSYDDLNNDVYGYGYGWGTSFTSALLYIVEYPD